MAERFDWKTVADRRDVVHQAVQRLAEGGVALFPTDTTYQLVAAARPSLGLARIRQWIDSANEADGPLAAARLRPVLSLARPTDLFRFAPQMPRTGRRLVERCLPGPLLLVTPIDRGSGELADFPGEVRDLVARSDGLGLQVADHASLLQTLRLLGMPVVAVAVPEGFDAASATRIVGIDIDAVIDDGPTRYGKRATMVRAVVGQPIEIIDEGILTANRVRRLAGEIVTFVCTGNTCRSPMAEGIFKRIAADALGCEPNELSDRGYTILSAGVAAAVGGPPAEEAVQIAHEYGIGIEDHATTPLVSDLVRVSDRIVTMTRDHRAVVVDYWPDAAGKTTTLGGPRDIADPVGHTVERYRQCAAEMAEHLRNLWREMQTT